MNSTNDEFVLRNGKLQKMPKPIPDVPAKEQRFIVTINRPRITVHGKVYTRAAISRGTGISLPMISHLFKGDRKPGLQTALRLASFFHVTVEELLAFVLPSNIRKSDEQVDAMREEILSGKRRLRQTYQGLVTGNANPDKLIVERANGFNNGRAE